MKNGYLWAAIIVIVAVVVGLYLLIQSGSSAPAPAAPQQSQTQAGTPPAPAQNTQTSAPAAAGVQAQVNAATGASAPTSATPVAKHFTVNGNDNTADVTTITVAKGTPVTITFGADAANTYHGGLDFRSSVVSTGTVAPGTTKTVSFTATQSFSFQPYWPTTNIAKPYTIKVVVTG